MMAKKAPKLADVRWDGKPISKLGMYAGVPMDVYHSQRVCAGPSVSSSGLRRALEENGGSPAHFWCEWSGNPQRVEPTEGDDLLLGRALHHLLLGVELFKQHFIIRPDEIPDEDGVLRPWSGAGCSVKARQKWTADAEVTGRAILTLDQVEVIKAMSIRLGAHPLVQEGILAGKIERTLAYQDKKTGLWVKSRPDAIPTASGDFADYKSTHSVAMLDVMRSITNFSYHQQAALVRSAAREVLNIEPSSYSLVFQEKKPPFCVRVVMLRKDDIDLGERQNRFALDKIAECLKAKHWPGPGEEDLAHHAGLQDYYRNRVAEQFGVIQEGRS